MVGSKKCKYTLIAHIVIAIYVSFTGERIVFFGILPLAKVYFKAFLSWPLQFDIQ